MPKGKSVQGAEKVLGTKRQISGPQGSGACSPGLRMTWTLKQELLQVFHERNLQEVSVLLKREVAGQVTEFTPVVSLEFLFQLPYMKVFLRKDREEHQ